MKIVGYAVLALLALPVIAVVAFWSWHWVEDIRYAREFFGGRVDIVRVIASKRWQDFRDPGIACTYAAVEFSQVTAESLRAYGPEAVIGDSLQRIHWGRWDVPWMETPAIGLSDSVIAPFQCLRHLPAGYGELIRIALSEPGSWYYEDRENGSFLSAEHRLAVILRYGD